MTVLTFRNSLTKRRHTMPGNQRKRPQREHVPASRQLTEIQKWIEPRVVLVGPLEMLARQQEVSVRIDVVLVDAS